MPVVVRRLEVAVGSGLQQQWQLAGIRAHGERSVGGAIGAQPGEELALHFERGLTIGRRLLDARKGQGHPPDGREGKLATGHGSRR